MSNDHLTRFISQYFFSEDTRHKDDGVIGRLVNPWQSLVMAVRRKRDGEFNQTSIRPWLIPLINGRTWPDHLTGVMIDGEGRLYACKFPIYCSIARVYMKIITRQQLQATFFADHRPRSIACYLIIYKKYDKYFSK